MEDNSPYKANSSSSDEIHSILGARRFITVFRTARMRTLPWSWLRILIIITVMFTLEQSTKAQSGSRVITYSFFNLGARWVRWSTPRPGRFAPGKETRYPLCRRLGGPQGRSGRLQKISPQPGFDSRTVQPVASRYTDWTIPVLIIIIIINLQDVTFVPTQSTTVVTRCPGGWTLCMRYGCRARRHDKRDTVYRLIYHTNF